MPSLLLRENTALIISTVFAAAFAAAGISLGLWVGSLMILFDGAYSLVSLALSLLAIQAARLVRRPGNRGFPFGYAAVQPLVIAVKGITITLICVLACTSAVRSLLDGGTQIDTNVALLFTAASVLGCALCAIYLRRVLTEMDSELVRAEYRQWFMDTVLSAAVLLGFATAYGIERTAWADYAVYADPLMVILVAGYFVWVPLRMTADALRELLLAAAPPALQAPVRRALQELGLDAEASRITKLGPYLMIELGLSRGIAHRAEAIRIGLYRRLLDLPARPVLLLHTESHPANWPWLEPPGERPDAGR